MKGEYLVCVAAAMILAGAALSSQVRDEQGEALFAAAQQGDIDRIKALLAEGVDVKKSNPAGVTTLHVAAAAGHEEVCVLLLGKGANVNARAWGNQTPLHWAALAGRKNVVELPLIHGADKGFVWGGVIACLQWPIVRAVGVPRIRFFVASAVGFAVGYPLGHTIQGTLGNWGLNWMVAYGSGLVILGLSLGMPQWWIFRRHMRRASRWILFSVIGWLLTGVAWIKVGAGSGADAIAYGIVTGVSLVWLVYSQVLFPLPDRVSHTPPYAALFLDHFVFKGGDSE